MGQSPRKILVRTPNYLGDHILARGFYSSLRQYYQNAHITFLCRRNLASFPDESLRNEKIILSERAWIQALSLRKRHWDLAVTLPSSLSSAFLLWLTGAKARVGFGEFGCEAFLTSFRPWLGVRSGKHKAELYNDLFEYLSANPAVSVTSPVVSQANGPIVIAPEASLALREWPHFLELMVELKTRKPELRFVLVGVGNRWDHLSSVFPEGIENFMGQTSLFDLLRVCSKARMVIANDSGVAHLAATLAGVPTLVLMGPGDPSYILPKGHAHLVRRVDLACSPCESAVCAAPYGYKACLTGLSVSNVLDQCLRLL